MAAPAGRGFFIWPYVGCGQQFPVRNLRGVEGKAELT